MVGELPELPALAGLEETSIHPLRSSFGVREARSTDRSERGESRAPATVAGCGNWLHRDDGVGPKVLASLRPRVGSEVSVVDVGTSVLGLLDHLHGQDLLVLVDACVGQDSLGSVVVREPDLSVPRRFPGTVHQVGPLETLIVAQELSAERLPRRIVMVLMETGGLEPSVEQDLCRRGVEAVLGEIDRWRNDRVAGSAPTHEAK